MSTLNDVYKVVLKALAGIPDLTPQQIHNDLLQGELRLSTQQHMSLIAELINNGYNINLNKEADVFEIAMPNETHGILVAGDPEDTDLVVLGYFQH